MKFLQRKQIIVLSLVLMLVIAGYLQYSYNKSSQFSQEDSAQVGDAVYVDNLDTGSEKATENNKAAVTTSNEVNNYFAQTKIDRDSVRSKDIETMKTIASDQLASKETRKEAENKILKLVDRNQKETNIESLIKGKGFKDAIALWSDNGNVNVIIKAPSISKEDKAKILDIVMREGNVSYNNIVIQHLY